MGPLCLAFLWNKPLNELLGTKLHSKKFEFEIDFSEQKNMAQQKQSFKSAAMSF